MANRFFCRDRFIKGEMVELGEQEFHHLAHVMRIKSGESVLLVNGKNQLAQARIQKMDKSSAQLTILSIEERQTNPQITLAQALFRLSRLEWLIEKAVELNVAEILLFPAQRSEKRDLSPSQIARLEQIAISAMKQCERLDLPKITFFSSLQKVAPQGHLFFGDPHAKQPSEKIRPPATFFIGPEGGFTDDEIHYLTSKGAVGVRLHHNILRAETAAIVALAHY